MILGEKETMFVAGGLVHSSESGIRGRRRGGVAGMMSMWGMHIFFLFGCAWVGNGGVKAGKG